MGNHMVILIVLMVKSALQLLTILLIVALAQDITELNDDPLYIYKISNINDYYSDSARSGYSGGVKIYVYGFGFDQIAENNLVVLNYSPCKVIEVSYNRITCVAGPYVNTDVQEVMIYVPGKDSYKCTSCYFYYSYYSTPTLEILYPKSGSLNSQISFIGNHRN